MGFPNEKLQKGMEIQKKKCRDEEIRKKEQEELLGEVTGNQLGTEYARQRETVSRWRERLSDSKCHKDTNMPPGGAESRSCWRRLLPLRQTCERQ